MNTASVVQEEQGWRRRLAWGLVATLGYMLSPLSPWNDAFVNVPIAIVFAKLATRLLGINEFLAFQIGYMLSNVAGIALLALGTAGLTGSTKLDKRMLLTTLAASLLYSLVASFILSALGVLQPP